MRIKHKVTRARSEFQVHICDGKNGGNAPGEAVDTVDESSISWETDWSICG